MNAVEIITEPQPKPALGRADWLRSALQLLISDGIDAVQITRLATSMSVTRGSFYWHFKGREDLLSAMLAEWHAANNAFFKETLRDCHTLPDTVLKFFEIWVGTGLFSPQLDQSVRDWARLDGAVLALVRAEDTRRIGDIADAFARCGFDGAEADMRARVLYFSQVGYTANNLDEAMNERLSRLKQYYHVYTGRELDAGIAKAFITRMRGIL